MTKRKAFILINVGTVTGLAATHILSARGLLSLGVSVLDLIIVLVTLGVKWGSQ